MADGRAMEIFMLLCVEEKFMIGGGHFWRIFYHQSIHLLYNRQL